MKAYSREHARDRVTALAGRGQDLVSFWREVNEVVAPLVPSYMGPCWYTLDPALAAHHEPLQRAHAGPAAGVRSRIEYYDDDVNRLVDVARSPTGTSTLHEATGGDPSSSPRWQANIETRRRPGADRRPAHAAAGDAWGGLGLYRAPGEPDVRRATRSASSRDRRARARGGRPAGAAVRRGAPTPTGPDAPGLIVLSARLGGRVGHAGRRALDVRPARRRLGRRSAAVRRARRSPRRRCARPRVATRPARSRSRACSRSSGPGSSCTARRWSATATGASR